MEASQLSRRVEEVPSVVVWSLETETVMPEILEMLQPHFGETTTEATGHAGIAK